MPNSPKTTAHTVRVDGPLWQAVLDKAEANGETASDVTRRAFLAYVSEDGDAMILADVGHQLADLAERVNSLPFDLRLTPAPTRRG